MGSRNNVCFIQKNEKCYFFQFAYVDPILFKIKTLTTNFRGLLDDSAILKVVPLQNRFKGYTLTLSFTIPTA